MPSEAQDVSGDKSMTRTRTIGMIAAAVAAFAVHTFVNQPFWPKLAIGVGVVIATMALAFWIEGRLRRA
jgi:hypothetical protein